MGVKCDTHLFCENNQMSGFSVNRGRLGGTRMTYAEAEAKLGKRETKKLENNTYLHRVAIDTLAVKLHQTDVVLIHSNGRFTLQTGGWQTVTTKDRINGYSPARVYSNNGVWHVGEAAFHDGMQVDSTGKPIGKVKLAANAEKAKKKLDKAVRDYINGFAAAAVEAGDLEAPGPGDCWGCCMKPTDGAATPPGGIMGIGHIVEHFREKYYVPSLLWNACQNAGNPSVLWSMIRGDIQRGDSRLLKRQLTSYFRKLKPALLAG